MHVVISNCPEVVVYKGSQDALVISGFESFEACVTAH